MPDQPASYLTVEAQRARITAAEHLYGILEDGALAGTVALSNLAHGSFQSASLGYLGRRDAEWPRTGGTGRCSDRRGRLR